MAAGYELSIKNNTETIEMSTKEKEDVADIKEIRFKMNTLDDYTTNRADSVRAELRIEGTITTENRDNTKKLAKWAMDDDRKTMYRDVELVAYEGENCSGDVLRRYKIDQMFVIDYEEEIGDKSDYGTFKLFIAQKDGSAKKDVFSS